MIQLWKVDITTTVSDVKKFDNYLKNCSVGSKTTSKRGKVTTTKYTDVIIPKLIPSNKVWAYAATDLMKINNVNIKGTIKKFPSFDAQAIVTEALRGDNKLGHYASGDVRDYVHGRLKQTNEKLEITIKDMEEVESLKGIKLGAPKATNKNTTTSATNKKKLAEKAPKKPVAKKTTVKKETPKKTTAKKTTTAKSTKGVNKAELAAKMKTRTKKK